MFKKIGLSAAAILAVLALAKPPAVMAADRDDLSYGRRNVRESRDYREHDYRDRDDQRRGEWRHEDRDRVWR